MPKNTTKKEAAARAERRREQTRRSLTKHRETRERVEFLLPTGWRDKLHDAVYDRTPHASTQAWFMHAVGRIIGERPPG